ncbi:hypothetical protein [Rossellomorea vietnamensis]|uniref:hypothetical protein n=1 Tax=Rossellomorea vietnamensis TaxID=218284 RepID=UPI003D27B456
MTNKVYPMRVERDQRGNNIYKYTKPFYFSNMGTIKYEYLIASYAFSYAMSFSEEGHHRRTRSGGSKSRKNVEVFCDAFIGKLGEFAVYQYFKDNGVLLNYPDVSIMGQGEWDSYDFIYKGRKIGAKTTKSIGNLLLLETKDWNQNAQYIPNLKTGNADYDDMLFVRVDSNIVSNLKEKKLYYNNEIDIDILEEEFKKGTYQFDISHVPIDTIKLAIQNKLIINKNDYLQSLDTKMDAQNYYIQSLDMFQINGYINTLKGIK